jgi:hypothetical protein
MTWTTTTQRCGNKGAGVSDDHRQALPAEPLTEQIVRFLGDAFTISGSDREESWRTAT